MKMDGNCIVRDINMERNQVGGDIRIECNLIGWDNKIHFYRKLNNADPFFKVKYSHQDLVPTTDVV